MTDKEKIRDEIERRYRENKADGYSDVCEELWDILSFIDSMQEEPVSEELREASRKYFKSLKDSCFISSDIMLAFKAGAQWKEKEMQSTIELAEDHAMLAGMEKMKEKMMAKAIDGEVGYWNLRGLSVNMDLSSTVEEGDKVKVIVIRED